MREIERKLDHPFKFKNLRLPNHKVLHSILHVISSSSEVTSTPTFYGKSPTKWRQPLFLTWSSIIEFSPSSHAPPTENYQPQQAMWHLVPIPLFLLFSGLQTFPAVCTPDAVLVTILGPVQMSVSFQNRIGHFCHLYVGNPWFIPPLIRLFILHHKCLFNLSAARFWVLWWHTMAY